MLLEKKYWIDDAVGRTNKKKYKLRMLEVIDITSNEQILKKNWQKYKNLSPQIWWNSDKPLTIYSHDIMAWYDEDRLWVSGLSHLLPLFLFNQWGIIRQISTGLTLKHLTGNAESRGNIVLNCGIQDDVFRFYFFQPEIF